MGWLTRTAGVRGIRTYRLRLLIQGWFALVSILIGVQFARFVQAAFRGETPLPGRPPGVEGYLPISGLMGLVDWIHQGSLNVIHPAATVLLITFLVISWAWRRGFCSWICPLGLLSESLARLGQLLFGRNFRLPRLLDLPLRGLRYLLLGFFMWAILTMTSEALRSFIESPYNRVSDVKMYLFFARVDLATIITLGVLTVGSILVNGAWCRYLCPYGALMGLAALVSPTAVRRDPESCTLCGACDRACMSRLPVPQMNRVSSIECTGCLDCLASCPVPGALTARVAHRRIGVIGFALGVALLFGFGYVGARLSGHWHNRIGDQEYIEHLSRIDEPQYEHPR
jgi:ferredoxin